jgi:hypothetical protein
VGDVDAAGAALLVGEKRVAALGRPQALAHADLRDVAAFALSEGFLGPRAAVEDGR